MFGCKYFQELLFPIQVSGPFFDKLDHYVKFLYLLHYIYLYFFKEFVSS